ncbi:MAG: hypothetical protein FJW37_12480 [Acidobacteria bacterium]|nr:hypothetical protein [Acidobacteriota bacterium]
MGRPLYRQLGFEDECPIERWARIGGTRELPGAPGGARPREPAPVAAAAALDCGAFGADRSELLSLLAAGDSADLPGEGFAMGRPGSRAAYFGPCVARSPEAARTLLEWFLARRQGETVYWDLLPGNPAAIRLARAAGFEPLRRLVRMARPGRARQPPDEPLRRRDSDVFAIAGFEYG